MIISRFLSFSRIASAVFLVAGTSIGGGMLALPVATGISGFIPSMSIMFICWIAMTLTALMLLEVSMWMEEGAHLITMTSRILGPFGKIVSFCLYLFICYASLAAYTAGGALQIVAFCSEYFDWTISKDMGAYLFIAIFGGVIYLGSRTIGRVNTVLFLAMIVAYILLMGTGISKVNSSLLLHQEWKGTWLAIPLLLTSFSFQMIVPSLTPYLKMNVKAVRIAIIGGTFITFLIYALWEFFILGTIPVHGPDGLAEALRIGEPATQFLPVHVDDHTVYVIAEYFAFFAIITSFLGIAFGLYDFLADGFKIKKIGKGKAALGLLIIVPTLIFATKFSRIFIVALEISGGFGDSILNGIIPILMVWYGRYRLHLSNPVSYRLAGGKPLLICLGLFFIASFILSSLMQIDYFK